MGCSPSSYTHEQIKYSKLADNLETGDIVLFSGHGAESYIIRGFGLSAWSHIGLVIKSEVKTLNENQAEELFLWHSPSNPLPVKDQLSDTFKSGPQLNSLVEVVNRYIGDVAIRKLRVTRTFENLCNLSNQDSCGQRLMSHLKLHNRKEYEKSIVKLFMAAEDDLIFGFSDEDLTSIFCSELVAVTYKYLGLIPNDMNASEYQPEDFSSHTYVKLNHGAKLDREVIVNT